MVAPSKAVQFAIQILANLYHLHIILSTVEAWFQIGFLTCPSTAHLLPLEPHRSALSVRYSMAQETLRAFTHIVLFVQDGTKEHNPVSICGLIHAIFQNKGKEILESSSVTF